MTHIIRWVLVALVLLGLPFVLGSGGCSGGALFTVDEPTEISLGKEAITEVEKQTPVISGTRDAERVERIGKQLAALTDRPKLPWSFKVVDSKEINAFALPGGPVYVTKGLLDLKIPDAELAAVLGHEATHINQRHSAKAIEKAMTIALITNLALRNQSDITSAAVNLALTYGITMPHSRANEYEADAMGVRLSYNAGYPADSMALFLKRLDEVVGASQTAEWMSDHPNTQARVQRTLRIAEEVAAQPRPVPYTLSQYDKDIIKHLPAADTTKPADNAPTTK